MQEGGGEEEENEDPESKELQISKFKEGLKERVLSQTHEKYHNFYHLMTEKNHEELGENYLSVTVICYLKDI